jgi:hypothetical protein
MPALHTGGPGLRQVKHVKQDWTLIRRIKDGHAYWRRNGDGAIGIADRSGTYPENCSPTDRPPLLLDRDRPVVIGTGSCSIPLSNDAGESVVTPASGFETLWVASVFGMEVETVEHADSTPQRFGVRLLA